MEFNRRIGPADPGQADIVATGPAAADGLARETVFRTGARDRVWVLFDQAVSPGGYAYLFVLEGWGTMGCAITRHFKRIDEFLPGVRGPVRLSREDRKKKKNARTAYSYMNFTLNRPPSHPSPRGGGKGGGWETSCRQSGKGRTHPPLCGRGRGYQGLPFGLGIRRAFETGRLARPAALLGEDDRRNRKRRTDRRPGLVGRFLYESSGERGPGPLRRLGPKGLSGISDGLAELSAIVAASCSPSSASPGAAAARAPTARPTTGAEDARPRPAASGGKNRLKL